MPGGRDSRPAHTQRTPSPSRRHLRIPAPPQLTEALLALPDADVPLAAKVAIAERAAGADKRLSDGADEELQLTDFMLGAHRAIKGIVLPMDRERQAII